MMECPIAKVKYLHSLKISAGEKNVALSSEKQILFYEPNFC